MEDGATGRLQCIIDNNLLRETIENNSRRTMRGTVFEMIVSYSAISCHLAQIEK